MAFSATNAATEGFRIVRREPWTIVAWAVVVLAFAIASLAVEFPFLAGITANAHPGVEPSQVEAESAMVGSLEFTGVALPFTLAAVAVFSCAVYRAVLRPNDRGFACLRIGADELRMALLFAVLGLLWPLVFAVLFVVVGGAVAAIGVMLGAPGPIAFLSILAAYVAILWVSIWLGVRLSLAGPMTFAQRRLRIRTAWKLTRGRFWPLLGCYLLNFAFVLMLTIVSLSVYALVSLATGGSMSTATTSMLRPDFSSIRAYLTPALVIYQVVGALLGSVIYAVYFAPAAAAYRAIAELSPDNQAAAFD